jgi:hypothetical protein
MTINETGLFHGMQDLLKKSNRNPFSSRDRLGLNGSAPILQSKVDNGHDPVCRFQRDFHL